MKRLQIGWVPKGGGGKGKVDAPGAGDAILETSSGSGGSAFLKREPRRVCAWQHCRRTEADRARSSAHEGPSTDAKSCLSNGP
jgi:hypothetical protein